MPGNASSYVDVYITSKPSGTEVDFRVKTNRTVNKYMEVLSFPLVARTAVI